MTKQEEIRDVKGGIGDVLRQMNTEVILESGRDYGYYIEKILRYLHSQGVVIKVDRELPPKAIGEIHEIAHSYTHLFEDYGLQIIAVEPLIKGEK